MGGIVAMFSEAGAVRPEALECATRALDHRGPDERDHWVDVTGTVGLGYTGLGSIDLDGGRQPVVNEDGSIRAVVDGAAHDFERLRGDLIARGHQFRSRSDSELVVHLYEEYGASCVDRLRGELAFVLYDARRDLLVAARDRFGIKPLVYGRHGGCWTFASEAKALFAAGQPAAWDRESFVQSCMLGAPLEDRTMFAGVQQVPAGHLLVASRHHHRLVRYWDFDYPADGRCAPRSEAEDHEALAEVLTEAVQLRLRADTPVACYLSGGIDSCTVLGLAQRHCAAPIAAFTLAFEDPEYDENARAREMAAHAGASYTPVPLRRADIARNFEAAVCFAERPVNNLSCASKLQLSRAVRAAGIRVVLTGEGSDEIFAGYPHFRRDLAIATNRPVRGGVARAKAGAPHAMAPRLSVASVRAALGGFAPSWIVGLATTGHRMTGLLRPELATLLAGGDPLAGFIAGLETSRQLRGRHPVHQAMYMWSKTMLPGYVLSAVGDRMEMAHALEARLPFLDHRVVELSTQLPIDRLIRGIDKYLLREVARPVVTDTVYRRPKGRSAAPELTAAENGSLHELLHDTLRGSLLRESPLFDHARVVALLDALPGRDAETRSQLDRQLLLILSACLLQRRFGLHDAT